MKTMRRGFLLFLLAGCSAATQADGVHVRLRVDGNTTVIGQATPITIEVVNTTERLVAVQPPSCHGAFEVVNARGEVVGPRTDQMCAAIALLPIIVSPGSTASFQNHWEGSARETSSTPTWVEPGEYFLRARVPVDGELRTSDRVRVVVRAALP